MHEKRPTRKALFVTYGSGHAAMTISVIRALSIRKHWKFVVLGLTTAAHKLESEGLPHKGFSMLQERYGTAESQRWGELLSEGMDHPLISREETNAYMGLSFADLVDEVGREEAERRYCELGRAAFNPVRLMERWISDEAPDIVVTTNSPRSEKAALTAARNLGIPTMAVVDLFQPSAPWLMSRQGLADRLCVISDKTVDYFVESGRRRDELIVTGNPAFDRLAAPELDSQAKVVRSAKGADDDFLILCASQREPDQHPTTGVVGDRTLPDRIESALKEMTARHANWRLIIRPHPSDLPEFTELPERVHWSRPDESLHPLLHAVDCLVVTASTVGLEGALANKPVITVDLSVWKDEVPFSKLGISRGVTDWKELERALVDAAQGKHPVHPELPPIGNAADRCVDVMESLT